jgi:hypothetical protein
MQFPVIQDAPTVKRSVFNIENFKGIDLSSSPSQIDAARSPDAPNMIGDLLGKPSKRTGFQLVKNYGGQINGRWEILGHEVIHAGTKLFLDGAVVWSGMKNEKSTAQTVGEKIYIFDGEDPIICDGEDAWPLADEAYIPTVFISKEPSGGGTAYEDVNLLSNYFTDSFYVSEENAKETEFQLSFAELNKAKVTAKILDSNGNWNEKNEGIDFTVNREMGTVTFGTAPGQSPIAGEDSVIITASKWFEDYFEKIAYCNQSIAYNSAGTQNRIFVSGNPDFPNMDFWCRADQPEYFPDLCYMSIGEGKCNIVGYSIIDGQLATHINPSYDGRSVILRKYQIDEESRATFPIVGVLQGEEAIAPRSFVYMETEPLFISAQGVYAITSADIDDRKYTQNRSYFINKKLTASARLANAECAKFKQYYVISIDSSLYLLDTSQKSYQKTEPLSTFQYECYLWTGINANVLWEKDETLYFGDKKGNVCKFATNVGASTSYEDYDENGNKAVKAYWTIPDFSGNIFWKNKTVRVVALELAPYAQNKVRLESKVNGMWNPLKEWTNENSYFSWSSLSWKSFTWSGNAMPRTLTLKTKIKKFDKVGFRIVCDEIDRAFGLYGFSLEFTENGRFKK